MFLLAIECIHVFFFLIIRRPPISTRTDSFPTRRSSDLRRGGSTAWVSSGWTTVAPGCKELLKSSGNMQMYTSLVRAYKHIGNRIMHFKFSDTNDKQGTRATAKTVEDFYRSEEHTSELQSLMRISYAVFCFKTKNYN